MHSTQLLPGPSRREPQLSTGVTCSVMPHIGFPSSPVPLIPVLISDFGGWGAQHLGEARVFVKDPQRSWSVWELLQRA